MAIGLRVIKPHNNGLPIQILRASNRKIMELLQVYLWLCVWAPDHYFPLHSNQFIPGATKPLEIIVSITARQQINNVSIWKCEMRDNWNVIISFSSGGGPHVPFLRHSWKVACNKPSIAAAMKTKFYQRNKCAERLDRLAPVTEYNTRNALSCASMYRRRARARPDRAQ